MHHELDVEGDTVSESLERDPFVRSMSPGIESFSCGKGLARHRSVFRPSFFTIGQRVLIWRSLGRSIR